MNLSRRHFWRLGAGLLAATGLKAKAVQPEKPSKAVADFKVNFYLHKDGSIGLTTTTKHPEMSAPVIPYPAEGQLTDAQRQQLVSAVKDVHDYVWRKYSGVIW